MKVKSSLVLTEALALLENNEQTYACAAIQIAEVDMRYAQKQDIQSKAMSIWMTFKPKHVREELKSVQQWWDKGDPARIATMKLAIDAAKKRND
jgi:hypothetical protein